MIPWMIWKRARQSSLLSYQWLWQGPSTHGVRNAIWVNEATANSSSGLSMLTGRSLKSGKNSSAPITRAIYHPVPTTTLEMTSLYSTVAKAAGAVVSRSAKTKTQEGMAIMLRHSSQPIVCWKPARSLLPLSCRPPTVTLRCLMNPPIGH